MMPEDKSQTKYFDSFVISLVLFAYLLCLRTMCLPSVYFNLLRLSAERFTLDTFVFWAPQLLLFVSYLMAPRQFVALFIDWSYSILAARKTISIDSFVSVNKQNFWIAIKIQTNIERNKIVLFCFRRHRIENILLTRFTCSRKSCQNQMLTQLLTTPSPSYAQRTVDEHDPKIDCLGFSNSEWFFYGYFRWGIIVGNSVFFVGLVKQTPILLSRKSGVFISLLKFPCNQIRPCVEGWTRMFILNGGKIEFFDGFNSSR